MVVDEEAALQSLYVQRVGRELLKMRISERQKLKLDSLSLRTKTMGAGRLLKKHVKVDDMEDGGLAVSIDQEWDTSKWSNEMIEAACDCLFAIFSQRNADIDEQKKVRAVYMLEKLLSRHFIAVMYAKLNLDTIVGQTVNKLIHNGKAGGMLDFLYVLQSLKGKFCQEISEKMFVRNFFEMLLMECRSAAVLIQHSYRSYRKMGDQYKTYPLFVGFGSEVDAKLIRWSYIRARNFELRFNWKLMHWGLSPELLNCVGGVRGPAHINQTYVSLGLDIVIHLASDKAGEYGYRNREDLLRCNGCIILSTFLCNHVNAPFVDATVQILSYINKVPESLYESCASGCLRGCMTHIQMLRELISLLSISTTDRTAAQTKILKDFESSTTVSDLSIISRVQNRLVYILTSIRALAVHAAGFYCATEGYGHSKRYTLLADTHRAVVDYSSPATRLHGRVDEDFVKLYLGQPPVPSALVSLYLETTCMQVEEVTLETLFALSCSHCEGTVMLEVVALGGRCFSRLLKSLHSDNDNVSALALCLLLQFCTTQHGRDCLMTTDITRRIASICKRKFLPPQDTAYEKAVFISSAVCRQHNWMAYDPEEATIRWLSLLAQKNRFHSVQKNVVTTKKAVMPISAKWPASKPADKISISATQSYENTDDDDSSTSAARTAILVDLLRTIKNRPPSMDFADSSDRSAEVSIDVFLDLGKQEGAEANSVLLSLLIASTTDENVALEFARTAEVIGCRNISEYVVHPEDSGYFASLEWRDAVASCAVLEALSFHKGAALDIFSVPTFNFLGQFIFTAKNSFLGKRKLSDTVLLLMLKGVVTAARTIKNLCIACIGHPVLAEEAITSFKSLNITDSVLYFAGTLSAKQPNLLIDSNIKDFLHTGDIVYGTLQAIDGYLWLLLSIDDPRAEASLLDVCSAGSTITTIIGRITIVFGRTERALKILENLCAFLYKLTAPLAGASVALNDWNLLRSLRYHLPPPIPVTEGMLLNSIEYRVGLGLMRSYFIELCGNLARTKKGSNRLVADGFLRHAMQKMMVIYPYLESREVVGRWKDEIVKKKWRRLMTIDFCVEEIAVSDLTAKSQSREMGLRDEFIACLRLISMVANNHDPKAAEANVAILSDAFSVVEICASIISLQECPRCDRAVLESIALLTSLSKDMVHSSLKFEKNDVLGVILLQLYRFDEFPDETIGRMIILVTNVANGLRTDYLADRLGLFFEPLGRISRLKDDLFSVPVRDAFWSISQFRTSAAVIKAQAGASSASLSRVTTAESRPRAASPQASILRMGNARGGGVSPGNSLAANPSTIGGSRPFSFIPEAQQNDGYQIMSPSYIANRVIHASSSIDQKRAKTPLKAKFSSGALTNLEFPDLTTPRPSALPPMTEASPLYMGSMHMQDHVGSKAVITKRRGEKEDEKWEAKGRKDEGDIEVIRSLGHYDEALTIVESVRPSTAPTCSFGHRAINSKTISVELHERDRQDALASFARTTSPVRSTLSTAAARSHGRLYSAKGVSRVPLKGTNIVDGKKNLAAADAGSEMISTSASVKTDSKLAIKSEILVYYIEDYPELQITRPLSRV